MSIAFRQVIDFATSTIGVVLLTLAFYMILDGLVAVTKLWIHWWKERS